MTRSKQLTLIAAAALAFSGLWSAEVSADTRRVRVSRPRVYQRVYRPPFYYSYWSPWYGASPYWWYGPYWDRPYYRRYYEPTGALRVQVSPRNTQVYVDGYFVGIADDFDGVFQRLRVAPGGHEIVLHLPGHRNATQSLYLQPGSTFNLKHQMEPLPAGAPEESLPKPNPDAVKPPDPRGEGDRYGEDRDERLPEDERVPEVDERRGPPRSPRDRDDTRVRESQHGSLAIRVQPSDAKVTIDGTEWRGAADDTGEILIQVPPGRHRIELRREGFETFSTEVDVRPGVTTPVNVLLQSREE
jgi:hypothetical protein